MPIPSTNEETDVERRRACGGEVSLASTPHCSLHLILMFRRKFSACAHLRVHAKPDSILAIKKSPQSSRHIHPRWYWKPCTIQSGVTRHAL